MKRIHATCLSLSGTGVLLLGPSGAGKSDLALRLVDGGALLVADDRVRLSLEDGVLTASAEPGLAGLLEVRGVGILPVPHRASAAVRLAVSLVPAGMVPRLPEPETLSLLEVAVPHLHLCPFEASAPAKLRLAVAARAASIPAVPARLTRFPAATEPA